MTGEAIKDKINFNNQQIEALLDPSVFVLQLEVLQLMEDNEYLRSICSHEYRDGICIYCGKSMNP